VTILRIRAVAPLLVLVVLSSLGCDGSDSNSLLFNGGVGPSPVSSSLIVTRPDVSAPPSGFPPTSGFPPNSGVSPTVGLPPTLGVPPTFGFPPPSTFVNRGVMVQPASIQAVAVSTPFCPVQQPFVAPFSVVFVGDGTSDLFLSSVQMQLVDLAELRAGVTTLGRPELAVQFGSTTIPTFGTRAFPFAFPFGCNGLSTGTLTVIVVVGDSRGREARTVRQLAIR
jgi:hypothetical protein